MFNFIVVLLNGLFSTFFKKRKDLIFTLLLLKKENEIMCTSAPNMNAYVERFNGTIRREALDHFLLFSEKQVRKIVKEYVEYYNNSRPHQGIDGIPDSDQFSKFGTINKKAILGGLHHYYFRSSA